MNVDTSSNVYLDPVYPRPQVSAHWVRVWDEQPIQGLVVPVWDGDYIYYASYWEKSGKQFWIISDSISPNKGETDLLKQAGEQVYPIHWMKLLPPTRS